MASPESPRFSRRTVAKGAAWTVPVIATAVGAPAIAASSDVCFKLQGGNAQRQPANPGVVLTFTVRLDPEVPVETCKNEVLGQPATLTFTLPDDYSGAWTGGGGLDGQSGQKGTWSYVVTTNDVLTTPGSSILVSFTFSDYSGDSLIMFTLTADGATSASLTA